MDRVDPLDQFNKHLTLHIWRGAMNSYVSKDSRPPLGSFELIGLSLQVADPLRARSAAAAEPAAPKPIARITQDIPDRLRQLVGEGDRGTSCERTEIRKAGYGLPAPK